MWQHGVLFGHSICTYALGFLYVNVFNLYIGLTGNGLQEKPHRLSFAEGIVSV